MQDLTIELENGPGALADMGECLGRACISIQGGGAAVVDGRGIAHFLVEDGSAARNAVEAAGIKVLAVSDVLVQRLNQEEPGQLGKLTRRMAEAGVNIELLYSDHDHQMILAVDDMAKGRAVSEAWERDRIAAEADRKQHHYSVSITWTGNDGPGTQNYRSFRRDFEIAAMGKSVIAGSSDPAFRGDPARYNPEELLVASLSSCHMLWYLHLCSVHAVVVLDYSDEPSGVMAEGSNGSGLFTSVTLRPKVTVADFATQEKALSLHHQAHTMCFIARSVSFPVGIEPIILAEER